MDKIIIDRALLCLEDSLDRFGLSGAVRLKGYYSLKKWLRYFQAPEGVERLTQDLDVDILRSFQFHQNLKQYCEFVVATYPDVFHCYKLKFVNAETGKYTVLFYMRGNKGGKSSESVHIDFKEIDQDFFESKVYSPLQSFLDKVSVLSNRAVTRRTKDILDAFTYLEYILPRQGIVLRNDLLLQSVPPRDLGDFSTLLSLDVYSRVLNYYQADFSKEYREYIASVVMNFIIGLKVHIDYGNIMVWNYETKTWNNVRS